MNYSSINELQRCLKLILVHEIRLSSMMSNFLGGEGEIHVVEVFK